MVKRIISMILVILILPLNSNAAIFHDTLDKNKYKTYEYNSNDITSQLEFKLSEQKPSNTWENLDDDSKNILAEMFGSDSGAINDFGSSTSGRGVKNVSIAGCCECICPVLSPAVLGDTGQWNYKENQYKVRTDEFKNNFTEAYGYACMMTNREYKMFYKLCQLYKWDYLVLLAKWNYQSAHQFCLERTNNYLNQGLAGQIVTEDGGVTYLDDIFTADELSKLGKKSRINNIWSTKVTGSSPGPAYKNHFIPVNEVVQKAMAIDFSEESAKRWQWLGSVTDDEKLERMKMNLIFLKEARLVLSSITPNGVTRDYSKKDFAKIREILEKEEWSDEDYNYCFEDLVTDDVVYKEYDNMPKYKQKAYLILKHWALGSSDSGTAHHFIGEIANYIKNKDFQIEPAKQFVYQALAGDIVASNNANGKESTKNAIKSYYDNPAFYGGDKGTYTRNIVGVDYSKLNKILEATSVPEYYDIFSSEFESTIEKNDLMKGVLFAMEAFITGDLNVNTMSAHGLCHSGITRQCAWLGGTQNACGVYAINQNGTHYNQGGAYVKYYSAINYWCGTGDWLRGCDSK